MRDRLAGSLGPRAVVSEDELPGTKHIKAPRRLLDGLRNLTESVIQAPARVISGLNNFLGETTRSQPAETVQTQQSQTPATQTQQSQTPTPPPPEQPQSTTQQEQTRPSISQPSSTDRSTDRSTDLSSLTSSAAATNTAPPPREPPQSALAVTAAPSSSALFEVAQTVFDKTKEAVKANAALVGDRVADLIIGELQVADWYSLHVIDLCRGDFESRSSSLGMTTAVCDGRYAGKSSF